MADATRRPRILTWKSVKVVATGLIVLLAASVLVTTILVPRLIGGAALTVLSGSMTPTYSVGSVIVVRPVDPSDLRVGDAITFAESSGAFTTHRIVRVDDSDEQGLSFITKGDANKGEDSEPVSATNVRGRVWFHVPHLGRVRDAVSSPYGLGSIVVLAIIASSWDHLLAMVSRWRGREDHMVTSQPNELDTSRPGDAAPPAVVPPVTPQAHLPATTPEAPSAWVVPDAPVASSNPDLGLEPQQLLVARLEAGAVERGQVLEILNLVRGHVLAFNQFEMVVSVTAAAGQLDAVERLLRPLGLTEASRSAPVILGRIDEATLITETHDLQPLLSSASAAPTRTQPNGHRR